MQYTVEASTVSCKTTASDLFLNNNNPPLMASGQNSARSTPTMKSDTGAFPLRRHANADSSAPTARDTTSTTDAENSQPDKTKGFNSHGAPVPAWLTALPSVLYAFAMLLFGEMVRADDDFPTTMRKIIISAGSLLALPVSSIIVYNLVSVDDLATPAAIVASLSSAPVAIGWTGAYLYARLTGQATPLLGDLWLVSTQLCIVTQLISNPDFEGHFAITTISMVALLLHTPRLPLHMAAFALLMLASMYNDSAMERSMPADLPLLMLPNPVLRGPLTRMFFSGCQASAFFIIYIGLYLFAVSAESARKRAGDAAFASAIAQELGRYDTMAAQELIAEAEGALAMSAAATSTGAAVGGLKETMAVDEELVTTFRVLTVNLDKFRPHIPNWLMDQVKEDDAERQAGAEREIEQLLTNRSGDPFGRPSSEDERSIVMSDVGRAISSVGSDADSRIDFGKSPRTPHTPGGIRPSPRKFGQVPSTGSADSGAAKDGHHVVNTQFLAPGVLCSRPGAMVRVNFRALHTGASRSSNAEVTDALHALVDGAHDLAHSSKAALHGFVGDELVVTWNAASRAVQPEAKAMRFLWRLRAMLSRSAGDVLSVTGAGMVGPLQVLLAGQGRTQALTVSTRWQSSLDALYRAAQEAGTVLVDRAMHSAASYACRARLVAALGKPTSTSLDNGVHCLPSLDQPDQMNLPGLAGSMPQEDSFALSDPVDRYVAAMELTGEVDDTKGEWMYVLKQNDSMHNELSEDASVHAAWNVISAAAEEVLAEDAMSPKTRDRVNELRRCNFSGPQATSLRWALVQLVAV